MDVRKILVILVIAVLYSSFVFSLIHAVYPEPSYSDYCNEWPAPVKIDVDCELDPAIENTRRECYASGGEPLATYDSNGCVTSIECSACREEYNAARANYSYIFFLITAILGAVSIFIGLTLPKKKQEINEWIGSGLLLGGLIVIFGGTVATFGNIHSWLRPIIMLAELALVIFLTYKLWGKKR